MLSVERSKKRGKYNYHNIISEICISLADGVKNTSAHQAFLVTAFPPSLIARAAATNSLTTENGEKQDKGHATDIFVLCRGCDQWGRRL